MAEPTAPADRSGLSLAPFRGLRPAVDADRLGRLLCPPYDVIDSTLRDRLLASDPANAVAIILPEPTEEGYRGAARGLAAAADSGLYHIDENAALYVYEMTTADGSTTRGLVGAVELRDPAEGVILPHEDTMAGPVADRLALMTATNADLEPIYLVYDGGGAASQAVRDVSTVAPLAEAHTPDGQSHRLWSITDRELHAAVAEDLADRRALIADGHHRYATYRERQRLRRAVDGPGPWDRGLALLVDATGYGPQVHAIHRVVTGLPLADAVTAARERGSALIQDAASPRAALAAAASNDGFAIALSDGQRSYVLTDPQRELAALAARPGEPEVLAGLDVTIVHRALVEQVWQRPDDVEHVHYAHSVGDALEDAQANNGTAVLLQPTPVAQVTAVAAAGARMPRKSTLFTPKPASGLVMRRLADQAS